jgi:hypothetical protein
LIGTMPNRAGHVTAQSLSRNGTTLRFRPQPGYYSGTTGNSVQRTDANFIPANIRLGVSLFGITGTLIPAPEDYRGAPGPKYLSHGDMNAGYFGRYAGIYTGNQLSSAAGISAGNTLFYATSNIEWLKFAFDGKVLFVSQKPIRYTLSWNSLNSAGCVNGSKQVTKGGITYKCRLIRMQAGEINLFKRVLNTSTGDWDNLTSKELHFSIPGDDGRLSLAEDTVEGDPTQCQAYNSPITASQLDKTYQGRWSAWRPVLEVV